MSRSSAVAGLNQASRQSCAACPAKDSRASRKTWLLLNDVDATDEQISETRGRGRPELSQLHGARAQADLHSLYPYLPTSVSKEVAVELAARL